LKEDLEKSRGKLLESERARDRSYKEMVQLKESMDILQNEQQILSQELTVKQNEVLKGLKQLT
jgi:hypothetical protein